MIYEVTTKQQFANEPVELIKHKIIADTFYISSTKLTNNSESSFVTFVRNIPKTYHNICIALFKYEDVVSVKESK